MSNINITINNLRISSLFTRHIITNGDYDNNNSIFISEYDIDEILEAAKEEDSFYTPKKVYYILIPHIFEIIRRQGFYKKKIFCFSLYQNIDNNNDFQTMFNDIEIHMDNFDIFSYEETLIRIFNEIRDCIDRMDEMELFDEECLRLIFIKNEILEKNKNTKPINKERTFKTDKCVVCLEKESNILFCNCGHLIACKECWENLNNKKYICMSCRKPNDIVRIIE